MTSVINYQPKKMSQKRLIELYRQLLKPRMIEEKMLILLRQGKISKWFSGIGQEAISVGVTAALQDDEFIFPMHRNLGVFTTRNVPLENLLAQWQGKAKGFTQGRDRSFHFGTMEHHIVGMISHLGPQLALADGVALANQLQIAPKVTVAFTGDGATSEGDFHEALNVASVWQLPVIFVIENNGYGLSTPTNEQYNCKNLADRGIGYGMKSIVIDGNDVVEVYQTISKLARAMRKKPYPVLVECQTFRMRGHEEASGTKYIPKELMDKWAAKDPVQNFENYLLEKGTLTQEKIDIWKQALKVMINQTVKTAFAEPAIESTTNKELEGVYKSHDFESTLPQTASTSPKRFIDAISDGLYQAMEKHDKLVLMGQDIAEYGGVFKITDGFVKKFGKGRVRNTPLCESAIVGISLGLSMNGYKAMMEMQFGDFVTCGFNQIVNNLAKVQYRWGGNADVVIRMPSGGGTGAGPFHSQTTEAWFFHTPGLKIVYPSNPYDAKGLLLAAFEDPNPVMFFEHKAMYRSVSADIPDDYYTIEIGKAALVEKGESVSIITFGMGVHWATETCKTLHIDADILDLRSLVPLDYEAIAATVKKTNRVLLLQEATKTGGVMGELAAYISEHLFEYLDAPVMRCASLDTPIPFSKVLEKDFLPVQRLKEKLERLLAY